MISIFEELRRRNVVRVGIAYAVVSWLLIQLAGTLEPALLLPDWVDRVVTVFLLMGFPVVLLFAWAFELTPEGLKRTSEVDRDESITPNTGKKLEHTIIGLLVLVVVFFVGKEFALTPDESNEIVATSAAPASIAVLPFEDFSAAKDQDYFSKGISEEILNLLAKTNALRVAARTSSFAFAGSELDIREIGNKLDVDTVLEGSIRTAGPNIRITAQLINVEDGYHLWSETYDRNYSDIFKIQDEIAASILDSLKVHLFGEEQASVHAVAERTLNLDAYNAYLIGKERLAQRTREDILAGKLKFEEVLAVDSEFAPAHVGIAHADMLLQDYRFGGEGEESPEQDAAITLALAPDLPEAVALQGYHHLQHNRYEEAEASLNRALSLNPSYALAYTWRADTASEQARYLDMLADLEKAYSLDPMSLDISAELAYAYRSFWRPKDAERVVNRMFDLHPEHPLAYDAALANLHAHGRLGEALLTAEKGLLTNPENENLLDNKLSGEEASDWYYAVLEFQRMAGAGPADSEFREYLDLSLMDFENSNVKWRERCMPGLIQDLRDVGRDDETIGMMATCFQQYEEKLKVGYLCPCSFFGLVMYTILDKRFDEAVERTEQWLSNGDSMSYLAQMPIFTQLADRPEYPEFLARNEEQLERQREIYRSGRENASVANR
jgi:TolB-like protein